MEILVIVEDFDITRYETVGLRGEIVFLLVRFVCIAYEESDVDQHLQLTFDGCPTLPSHVLEFGERHEMDGMAQQFLDDEVARVLRQQLE